MTYDVQWEQIDEHYKVIDTVEQEGLCHLTAKQLNHLGLTYPKWPDARNLVSFDTKSSLPEILRANELSILKIRRGDYYIGSFDQYAKLIETFDTVETRRIRKCVNLDTLDPTVNEPMGLNFACANGMLTDFVGEDKLYATISGRQGTSSFSYTIESLKDKSKIYNIEVDKAQIEIDAGFEGDNSVVLLEIKDRLLTEFRLAQLYYPYRAWNERTKKQLRTVFAIVGEVGFYFYEYVFPDPHHFNGEGVRAVHYVLDEDVITEGDLRALLDRTKEEPEPRHPNGKLIPFPQANSISITLGLIQELGEAGANGLNKRAICELYGLGLDHDCRQGDYYGNSACYLGFAERKHMNTSRSAYFITKKGREYLSKKSPRERHLIVCEQLFKHKAFRLMIDESLSLHRVKQQDELAPTIQKCREDLKEGTPYRRAGTIRSWLLWVMALTE